MKKCDEFFLQNKPTFLYGAVRKEQFINNKIPEVGFIGKSNVGKSSLINAITNSKIAKTSKTPGRTRELNFFNIVNKLNIVDMPGYGFAKVTENEKGNWYNFIYEYISSSRNLKRVFLLLDARRGLQLNDFDFVQLFDDLKINYQIVLTKIDTCKKNEIDGLVKQIEVEAKNHKTLESKILCVSSEKKYGISEFRDVIIELIFCTKSY